MRIGIDLMGSDQPPEALFEAVVTVYEELKKEVDFVLIATHDLFAFFRNAFTSSLPLEIVTVPEAIEMEESPLLAVRRKKNSSMAAGVRLLKEGLIDAFVSTGNTGALVATAMHHLPTLPGVRRAALLAVLPTLKGDVATIDVGANLLCTPQHLVQFATLAVCYRSVAHHMEKPKIGLLNIGAEEAKGTKQVKETYAYLHKHFSANEKALFVGNVEGREVFQGICDVLVTDGFTGNVFLKTAEGVSSFILDYLKNNHSPNSLPLQFDYSQNPGALLFGVDGVIIKCHGNATLPALLGGIKSAIWHAKHQILEKIKSSLN